MLSGRTVSDVLYNAGISRPLTVIAPCPLTRWMSDSMFVPSTIEEWYDLDGLEERLGELEEEIRLAMVEPDPNDEKDVIVEIRPGGGAPKAEFEEVSSADDLKLIIARSAHGGKLDPGEAGLTVTETALIDGGSIASPPISRTRSAGVVSPRVGATSIAANPSSSPRGSRS